MKPLLSYLMPLLFIFSANAQQLQLMLSLGHLNDVYSPDGKYIVTAVNDNTTKVWRGLIWKFSFGYQRVLATGNSRIGIKKI